MESPGMQRMTDRAEDSSPVLLAAAEQVVSAGTLEQSLVLEPVCPLCGKSSAKAYAATARVDSPHPLRLQCRHCAMIWAHPAASVELLAQLYSRYYDKRHFAGSKESAQRWRLALDSGVVRSDDEELHALAKRLFGKVPLSAHTRRWLEVGAGLGQLSYLAHRTGFDVSVTDLDADALAFIKSEFGITKTYQGPLESLTLEDSSFDTIVIHHVLEHVSNMRAELNAIGRILRPGGVLFVGVPNLSSLGYTLYRTMAFWTFRIPGIVDGVEHTLAFTPNTLTRSLVACGFKVRHLETRGNGLRPSQLRSYRRRVGTRKTLVRIAEALFHTKIECYAERLPVARS